MKPFDLQEYIKNPNQILVLEHYKDPVEYWRIKAATVVMDKKLAVRTPETGYCTDEIEVADGDAIRDEDHNLVGYIRFAEPGDCLQISIDELSKMVAEMKVGDVIDFNCNEDGNCWGINKTHILGADVLVVGSYGGGSTHLHDLTIDGVQNDILEFLKGCLEDDADGFVYWEIPRPKVEAQHKAIVLYSTDAWHTHYSRELVGVFSDENKLSDYLLEMKNNHQLTDEDFNTLVNHSQTQGNEINYLVETEIVNPHYGK